MLVLQSIILGIVQGLAEFLPISSSAHLIIVPWFFGWNDPALNSLTFDVALHLGTLVAILAVFSADWRRIIAAWFRSVRERKIGKDQDRRLAWYLLLACVPGGFAGFLFENKVQRSFHELPIPQTSMIVMAIAMAAMGGLLWLADARRRHLRTIDALGAKDAAIIGFAQALAIFPGVSRSGATITAGLALGFKREDAAKFSFLLSAPIIAGAGLKSILELARSVGSGSISSSELALFPIGFVVAGISGFFCIKILMKFLQNHSTKFFAWYRWSLAAIVLATAIIRG
ncbi:MAG TPA: undecaprenyl-diphosphatase UppP [Treponemataceae bacterium]|nr:undecaprenyl-diphosphatase UppP [Treponemataceae bacterium]